ncbi:hypothetical protein Tco_0445064 [Tanacetum coccineum]
MNNKKHIIGLDQFRDILQICPKVGNKKFVEPPLEKEILIFLASLGHSGDIRKITDVNVNKLHQPWRSFAAITKLVVNFVMEKDPSIPRRNKVNWHYARDDPMFTTINVISRNEVTQLILCMGSGTIPPKTKGSKKKANTDTITKQKPPTAPIEKKSRKGKLKTTELETISEAELTEAEQLKIVTKRSRQEITALMQWFCDDDKDDEQAQDEEVADKNDVNKTTQDDEDDDAHDVDEKAANLSELELKKILIDKMEANNSINRSDIQRQLYKALVDAYEADKILLDTYGDTVTIKRPRDGADDDQEPSAGTDRGSKRRRSGKEPDSTSAPSETTTKTAGKTTSTGSKTHRKSASQSAPVEEAMQTTDVFEAPAHQEFETGVQDEQAEEEAANYGHIKWIEDLVPNSMWSQMIVKYDKFALWGISHWGKKRRQFYALTQGIANARDVYSKRRIIAVTKVEIVEWHDYKHLDWITVRRDDDVLYKFKEGDFHRLRDPDIEAVVVEDLQYWVLKAIRRNHITKPDTYQIQLRDKMIIHHTSESKRIHYENKDKKIRLMRI